MVDVMNNVPVGEITVAAVRFWYPFLKNASQLQFFKRYKCNKP